MTKRLSLRIAAGSFATAAVLGGSSPAAAEAPCRPRPRVTRTPRRPPARTTRARRPRPVRLRSRCAGTATSSSPTGRRPPGSRCSAAGSPRPPVGPRSTSGPPVRPTTSRWRSRTPRPAAARAEPPKPLFGKTGPYTERPAPQADWTAPNPHGAPDPSAAAYGSADLLVLLVLVPKPQSCLDRRPAGSDTDSKDGTGTGAIKYGNMESRWGTRPCSLPLHRARVRRPRRRPEPRAMLRVWREHHEVSYARVRGGRRRGGYEGQGNCRLFSYSGLQDASSRIPMGFFMVAIGQYAGVQGIGISGTSAMRRWESMESFGSAIGKV